MPKLTAAQRAKMPANQFAAGKGHFPINDDTHAREAISGATRSKNAGNISAGEAASIKAKARAKLAKDGHPQKGAGPSKAGIQRAILGHKK